MRSLEHHPHYGTLHPRFVRSQRTNAGSVYSGMSKERRSLRGKVYLSKVMRPLVGCHVTTLTRILPLPCSISILITIMNDSQLSRNRRTLCHLWKTASYDGDVTGIR